MITTIIAITKSIPTKKRIPTTIPNIENTNFVTPFVPIISNRVVLTIL